MQVKNFISSGYKVDVKTELKSINSLMRDVIVLLVIFMALIFVSYHIKGGSDKKYDDKVIADFRFDINKLSDATRVLELKKKAGRISAINSFGSDGRVLGLEALKPDLRLALVKIADFNSDGKISDEEVLDLKLMGLEASVINKQLSELQYHLDSPDRNLENYIVVTQGNNAGTVLYNGHLKFIDSHNKRYFGIGLFR